MERSQPPPPPKKKKSQSLELALIRAG